MATEVLMPRQGQSVESCIIIEWSVNEGDVVTQGQALCEVETDKATFEVEAIGACNTFKRMPSGKWKAFNTDSFGFQKSIGENHLSEYPLSAAKK